MLSTLQTKKGLGDKAAHVIINSGEFKNKKYKEQKLKEIIATICGMLNTNGGKVVIHVENDANVPIEGSLSVQVIRRLEQTMISLIGLSQTVSKINFNEDAEDPTILIKKNNSLITTNYHLYLPSQKQVVQVPPLEPPKKVIGCIISRKIIEQPVQLHTHCQKFLQGKHCGLHENKTTQLKNLKAEQSKCTRLSDRMTGKANKFSCYVSAFANHRGGHLYYGIKDDGFIEGEEISNDDDKSDIIKKVEKAINKMIWPEEIGQPKRGEHWEIFFEPVLDENSKPIPSTFMIVIYIAPCLGGVFTEEPECYEMVEGIVEKISYSFWKKRMLRSFWRVDHEIPQSVQRAKWSSHSARMAFTVGSEKLRQLISNGDWAAFNEESETLQRESVKLEMKLSVLSQIVKAHYRRGEFTKALEYLKEYEGILPQTRDRLFFEVMGFYLRAGIYRAKGDFKAVKDHLTGALENAELIEPGLVTATVYTFAGTVTDLFSSPDILCKKALAHLQLIPDSPGIDIHSDKKQKAHINLANFYLGCNISERSMKENVDISSLNSAKASIMAVQKSVLERSPLSSYYDVRLNLVCSVYNYRQSQLHPDKKTRFLRYAFDYAKKAERLAKDCQFVEMVECSKAYLALFMPQAEAN